MSYLELSGIQRRFGAVVALDGVDLMVPQGSRVAIVGPSGSGKTTLLRIIAGFDLPDAGEVRLDGEVLVKNGRGVPPHQRGIGVVAQDGALFPHLTVAENIGFGLARGDPGRDRRVRETLDMVELDPAMLARRPDELSGGQQQRVALARAMATRPRLMLLDEPFSALDTGLRANMRHVVSELLRGAGITTILITHDQAEALSFADQVGVMRAGKLHQVGTPRDIYFQPQDPMVAEFMGDCLIMAADLEAGWANCALGRIEAASPGPDGACHIMLRPEQILLTPLPSPASAPGRPVGRVLDIDFAGRTSTAIVELRPQDEGVPARTLVLKGVGSRGLLPGSDVVVTVVGSGYLLPG